MVLRLEAGLVSKRDVKGTVTRFGPVLPCSVRLDVERGDGDRGSDDHARRRDVQCRPATNPVSGAQAGVPQLRRAGDDLRQAAKHLAAVLCTRLRGVHSRRVEA